MNIIRTSIIGMKPKDAIKVEHVGKVISKANPKENLIPEDSLNRCQPGEQHRDKKRQATDFI